MIKSTLITISLFLLTGSNLIAGTKSSEIDLQIEREITEGKIQAAIQDQKVREQKDQISVILGLIDDQAVTITKNDLSRAEEMAKVRLQVVNTKSSLKGIWDLNILESIKSTATLKLQELNKPKAKITQENSEEIPGTKLHPELGTN